MLPILAVALVSCNKDNGDELSGDDIIQFKDPNFLKALLTEPSDTTYDYVDANGDRQITVNEAKATKKLAVWDAGINDMSEIKYFTTLEYLNCSGNNLTTLDISSNTLLTDLDCYYNQLTQLDISNNQLLVYLDCSYNNISSLDVSKNADLEYLFCCSNSIATLNLGNNKKMKRFSCADWTFNGEDYDIEEETKCPLESITLYKNHTIDDESMLTLKLAYPDLEITYVE